MYIEKLDNLSISLASEYEYCPRSFIYRYYSFKPFELQNYNIMDGKNKHFRSSNEGKFYNRSGETVLTNYYIYSRVLNINGYVDRIIFKPNNILQVIEEKRGRLRNNKQIEIQVALEVYCLKEMFPNYDIQSSIYYIDSRRHQTINLEFVSNVPNYINNIRENLSKGKRFIALRDARCNGCMFKVLCGEK